MGEDAIGRDGDDDGHGGGDRDGDADGLWEGSVVYWIKKQC